MLLARWASGSGRTLAAAYCRLFFTIPSRSSFTQHLPHAIASLAPWPPQTTASVHHRPASDPTRLRPSGPEPSSLHGFASGRGPLQHPTAQDTDRFAIVVALTNRCALPQHLPPKVSVAEVDSAALSSPHPRATAARLVAVFVTLAGTSRVWPRK